MSEPPLKDWVAKLKSSDVARGLDEIHTLVRRDTQKAYSFYQQEGQAEAPTISNVTLARVMDQSLRHYGGIEYDRKEQRFAETLVSNFETKPNRELGSEREIEPFTEEIRPGKGSSDVGDVSWMAPTVGLSTATWVPGTSAHTWQAVAAGGTSIGSKGMLLAARTMGLTAVQLFENPELVESARVEWRELRGDDFDYQPLLGDRDPPLDYRVNK